MNIRALIVNSLFLICVSAVVAAPSTSTVSFDGKRAYEHLARQVGFGPRLPGSLAIEQTRKYITDHLNRQGFKVSRQPFTAHSEMLGRSVSGVNIIAVRNPAHGNSKLSVVFSAHYDSRPMADRDPEPANRSQPVPGANDGASGVAILLELAKAINDAGVSTPIGLLFFDLEDHGLPSNALGFCAGSRYMAGNMPADLDFDYGINLDMVGDSDLLLRREGFSMKNAPEVVQRVWSIGMRLYPSAYANETMPPIYDDHVPFQERGRKYIDLIDFEYPAWHTLEDTLDKCSSDSLSAVGAVLFELVR